jgi:hypothetical protein
VGCSFDNFSTDDSSRAYIWVLMVLAWLVPMIFIAAAYLSILVTVRTDFGVSKNSGSAKTIADQQRHKVGSVQYD